MTYNMSSGLPELRNWSDALSEIARNELDHPQWIGRKVVAADDLMVIFVVARRTWRWITDGPRPFGLLKIPNAAKRSPSASRPIIA